jgi:hypothetical protein
VKIPNIKIKNWEQAREIYEDLKNWKKVIFDS